MEVQLLHTAIDLIIHIAHTLRATTQFRSGERINVIIMFYYVVCLLHAEPRDTQPGDVHTILGIAAGVQSGRLGTGYNRAGDDRRRR